MKKTFYILMGAALLSAACNKQVKTLDIERQSGVVNTESWAQFIQGTGTVNTIGDETYYQNLRDWKKAAFDERGLATRSISYIFFADYGSMAFRFADIPDSIDVINLWGGCPKKGSLDYQEMKACQEVKGMKVVGCRITRILENARWGMEAQIPSFMQAHLPLESCLTTRSLLAYADREYIAARTQTSRVAAVSRLAMDLTTLMFRASPLIVIKFSTYIVTQSFDKRQYDNKNLCKNAGSHELNPKC